MKPILLFLLVLSGTALADSPAVELNLVSMPRISLASESPATPDSQGFVVYGKRAVKPMPKAYDVPGPSYRNLRDHSLESGN